MAGVPHSRGDIHLPRNTARPSAQSMGSFVSIHTITQKALSRGDLRTFVRRAAPTLRETSRRNPITPRLINTSRRMPCPNKVFADLTTRQILMGSDFDLSLTSVCHPFVVRVVFSRLLPADAYRSLFKFGVFNAIQSTCFDTVRLSAAPAISHILTFCQVNAHCAKFSKATIFYR